MGITLIQRSGLQAPTPVPGAQFFCSSIIGEGNLTAGLGGPCTERAELVALRSHPNRVYAYNINFAQRYVDGHYNGQIARVYVVENGVRRLLRSAPITATKLWPMTRATGGAMATSTQFEYAFNRLNRDGDTVWFSVRAADVNGQLGIRSAWASYTLPDPVSNGSASNETTVQPLSDGGSLAGANNVAVSAKSGNANTCVVTWDPVPGAAGYVVDLLWQDPAISEEDEYIELGGTGLGIPEGAHVLIEGRRLTAPTTLTGRIWSAGQFAYYRGPVAGFNATDQVAGTGAEWIPYTGDDPAPSGLDAAYFMRTAASPFINYALHSGIGDDGYVNLEPGRSYKLRFLIRAQAPTTLSMTLAGVSTGASDSYAVTSQWQWFETDVAVDTYVTGDRIQFLRISGTGMLDVAALEFFDVALDKDDLTSSQIPRTYPDTYLRDHRQIKPGFRGTDMDVLTAQNGFGARYSTTLHSTLRHCQLNTLKPWLQIEWHHAAQEWHDFLAYMAAPVASGHPMALKRQAQGQEAPWTDVFPDMILEIGNESWLSQNTDFWNTPSNVIDQKTGQAIPGDTLMGIICDDITLSMQSSPYWEPFRATTAFLLGGHFNSAFGSDAAVPFRALDYLSTAAYVGGGWDTGGSISGEDGQTYAQLLGYVGTNLPISLARKAEADAVGVAMAIYESGPAYFNSGLSKSQIITQEVVQKSRAAGVACLDAVAARAAAGYGVDCYFLLGEGNFWESHASEGQGGGTFLPYGLLQIIYEHTGPAHVSELATNNTSTRPDGQNSVISYVFTSAADPSNRVIAVLNRNIDTSLLDTSDPDYSAVPSGAEAITVATGLSACTGLAYFANVGNFREHNRYPAGQRLNTLGSFDADALCVAIDYQWQPSSTPSSPGSLTITEAYGATASGLPAGNCVLLRLTGCAD